MKIYSFKRSQNLPLSLSECWKFFSSPQNLARITPEYMGFKILYISGDGEMYPGQIIRYKIYVLPGIPMNWTTEITHVQEPHFFVDEQRSGPYAFWHHQHRFKEIATGVEMTDELNYAVPFGLIGRMANLIFVQRQLNAIFDYRFKVLSEHFADHEAIAGSKTGPWIS